MYCPNCGESRDIHKSEISPDVLVERGDYDSTTAMYSLESETTVLSCKYCEQEFILL